MKPDPLDPSSPAGFDVASPSTRLRLTATTWQVPEFILYDQ